MLKSISKQSCYVEKFILKFSHMYYVIIEIVWALDWFTTYCILLSSLLTIMNIIIRMLKTFHVAANGSSAVYMSSPSEIQQLSLLKHKEWVVNTVPCTYVCMVYIMYYNWGSHVTSNEQPTWTYFCNISN